MLKKLLIIVCLICFSQEAYAQEAHTSTELDEAIALSIALSNDRSFAYNFSCGYYIDGILIHEGIPRYGQNWWGFATYDRIVIKEGLSDEDKMMVFAHERKHYDRMHNGLFDRLKLWLEEKIAYLYGWNESNCLPGWDRREGR